MRAVQILVKYSYTLVVNVSIWQLSTPNQEETINKKDGINSWNISKINDKVFHLVQKIHVLKRCLSASSFVSFIVLWLTWEIKKKKKKDVTLRHEL